MALSIAVSRRMVIGWIATILLLSGFLFQPAGALAGFATSPGSGGPSSVALACSTGKHFADATILA